MDTNWNSRAIPRHSNRCTRKEFRMHKHQLYDHISTWIIPETYESVFQQENHSSLLQVYKNPDQSNEHDWIHPTRSNSNESVNISFDENLTKTFFNLISRCTRPKQCKYLIPSTTSKAIRILKRKLSFNRPWIFRQSYRTAKSKWCRKALYKSRFNRSIINKTAGWSGFR